MIEYEHVNNPRLRGRCTEKQWEIMRNNPRIRQLYKVVSTRKDDVQARTQKAVETPPEVMANRKKKGKETEADGEAGN